MWLDLHCETSRDSFLAISKVKFSGRVELSIMNFSSTLMKVKINVEHFKIYIAFLIMEMRKITLLL